MALTEEERKVALEIISKVYKSLSSEEREKLGGALVEAVTDFAKAASPDHAEAMNLIYGAFKGIYGGDGEIAKTDGKPELSFHVPSEVVMKIDGVVTEEEMVRILEGIPWAHEWAEGILTMAGVTPTPEKIRDLIRRKLVPSIRRGE